MKPASSNTSLVAHFLGIENSSCLSEFHIWTHTTQAWVRMCHPIHAAGPVSNGMNRFLFSNLQEVLFVNFHTRRLAPRSMKGISR